MALHPQSSAAKEPPATEPSPSSEATPPNCTSWPSNTGERDGKPWRLGGTLLSEKPKSMFKGNYDKWYLPNHGCKYHIIFQVCRGIHGISWLLMEMSTVISPHWLRLLFHPIRLAPWMPRGKLRILRSLSTTGLGNDSEFCTGENPHPDFLPILAGFTIPFHTDS